MRLLLVEDDQEIASGVIERLSRMGYNVEYCVTGSQAKQALSTDEFALAIFDLGLPDGIAIPTIRSVRQKGLTLPILVLTAWDQIETKVDALNAGADDYMVKPFDVRELEARIRALVRRNHARQTDVLAIADISLDLTNYQCEYKGEPVDLTQREWLLLKEFMLNPNRILTKDHLEAVCYGWDSEVESNALEVHIHHLRKKFDRSLIRTVRGMGYQLSKGSSSS